MAAELLGLLAVRLSVLAIFAPTDVTLSAGGRTVRVELRTNELRVDGEPRPSVRMQGAPLVTVTVRRDGRERITRHFRGSMEARAQAGAISLIDDLPDEEYLPGTVALEAGGPARELLRAQAVVARTLVAHGARHGGAGFDLCDLTHCQTYRGADGETAEARAAVADTAGLLLTAGGHAAEVYFSATCGGATADAADVWPGTHARPWLRSVPCDDCRGAPDHDWRADLALSDVDRALDAGGKLTGVTVLERGAGGWVRRVRLDGDGRTLTGEQLRVELGRTLGWSVVKSSHFTVERHGDRLSWSGRGAGHGVGMCESGAAQMAARGLSWRQILARYFPGAEISTRR